MRLKNWAGLAAAACCSTISALRRPTEMIQSTGTPKGRLASSSAEDGGGGGGTSEARCGDIVGAAAAVAIVAVAIVVVAFVALVECVPTALTRSRGRGVGGWGGGVGRRRCGGAQVASYQVYQVQYLVYYH